jgi:site-specific DNA-methyltransferase (adenine-specific)
MREDAETARVINRDCRHMREVEDQTVQLVLTSPPYWNLVDFDAGPADLSAIREQAEFFAELGLVWRECYRVLRPGGKLVVEFEDIANGSRVYGHPREICLVGDMVASVEAAGLELFTRLIWLKAKAGGGMRKAPYTCYGNLRGTNARIPSVYAYVFVFRKYDPTAGIDRRQPDFTRQDWKQWAETVWHIENPRSNFHGHPSVYPPELVRRLIRMYSYAGDLVLDPFAGVGTTLIAAAELGRRAVGYEIHPTHWAVARKRLRELGREPKRRAA